MLTTLTLVLLSQITALRPTAVSWKEWLLVADADGTVRAWSAKGLEFDADLTRKLNGDGLLAIATSEDGVLWGFDGHKVFKWEEVGAEWELQKSKPSPKPCHGFAVVDGSPVCTWAQGVHRFTDGTDWQAPPFADQLKGQGFGERPSVLVAHGTQLAIGTDFGEWGGYLWLLDVATGAWSKYYDPLGGVAGVTWNGRDWAVAWSMSHFFARTRVRLHRVDAKPRVEGPELKDRYLRAIASDRDGALIGLEQHDLVRVKESLALRKLQSVGTVSYGAQPLAVGVSPGIAALLALGKDRALLVPEAGSPLVVGPGQVTPLRLPVDDAGTPQKKP